MQTVVGKFPGGGITYLTITDPIVYDVYSPNGTYKCQATWKWIQ